MVTEAAETEDVVEIPDAGGGESDAIPEEFMNDLNAAADIKVEEASDDEPVESDPAGDDKDQDQDDLSGAGGNQDDDPEDDADDEDEDGEETPVADDALIERAVRAGISLADAKVTPVESLGRIVGQMEAAGKKSGEDDSSEVAEEEDPFDKLPDLDPEEYSEEVVSTFAFMKEQLKSQRDEIKAMQGSKQESSEAADVEAGNAFIGWFDGEVAGLGAEYEDVLGKGGMKSLSDEGQALARNKIARHMDLVAEDFKSEGKQAPSRDEAFKLAVKSAFPDKANEITGKETAKKAAARSNRVINQPRSSTGQFTKGEALTEEERADDAVAAVAAMMAEN